MKKVLAFDLGASNLRWGIFEGEKLTSKNKVKTEKDPLSQISCIIKDHIKDVEAIGLGMPGPLNFKGGVILNPPNIPELSNTPLKQILAKNFGKPIFLDNDANCALQGEAWKGAATGLKNAVMLTLGTGIGSGILINGKIYRGATGAGAELGHIIVMSNENYEDLEKLIQNDHENQAEYLKIAIHNIQKIFEPEAIILGGGWAEKVIKPLTNYGKQLGVNIKLAELDEWAGVYGAAKGAL